MQQRPDGKPEKETSHKGLSGTVCRNPIRRTLREDGVSEAVGAMLLITIVAMGISIFVAGVVLQPVVSDPPAFTVNVSYGSGGEVYIRHIGGESVSKDLLHVYIDTGATVEDVQPLLEISSETTWTEWHIGDTLVYTPDTPLTEPPEVAMIYADQSGAQYLYYASYNWTGAIPAATPGTPPVAAFSANPVSGTAPLTVRFTETSTGRPTQWSWTFGDGSTSIDRNPEHTYATPGTYTVSLTAGNAFGSDTEEKAGYITVNVPPAPVANFVGTPLSGGRPHVVQLTDTSTNVPTSWAWTFGDGETSTLQNPSHTYVAAGTYTVTLTATNAGGSDTETKVGYVTVTELQPPTAAFSANVTTGTAPLAVQFTDASTNEPTSWSWTFGDGGTSMLQSPGHTYAAAGTYTVSLTATNAAGSDAETKTGYITVTVPPPVADFSAIPTSGTAPHVVQFTDTSTNGPTSWAWTFGDGGTSILQNPSHTYASAGIYTVTLTATNAGGSDTETKTGYITVEAAPTLYNIKLWANKSGYLQNGGYLQFRVTDRWSSYITLDSVGRRDLDDEEIVRLTIGSDGSGGINMGGTISNFDFDDVTLSINGLPVGTGGVSSIQINSYDNLVSTLTLNVPPVDAQTDFQVVGGESINGIDDHQIIITNIKPLSGSTVYLDTSGATVNYEGGAEAYQLILPPQHTSTLQVSAKRNNENLNLGFSYWGDIGGTQTTPFTIQRTQGDSSFTVTIRAADGYTHGSWRPFQYWKLDGITQYGNPLVVTVPDSAERTLIAYY